MEYVITPGEQDQHVGNCVACQALATIARAAPDAGKTIRGKDVLTTAEREELAQLRRLVRRLQQERDISAKAAGLVRRRGRQDVFAGRIHWSRLSCLRKTVTLRSLTPCTCTRSWQDPSRWS
jgi:transposase